MDGILAITTGSVVALGLARFGYGLVVPAMRTDLSLSYAEIGVLGSANTAHHRGSRGIAAKAVEAATRGWNIAVAYARKQAAAPEVTHRCLATGVDAAVIRWTCGQSRRFSTGFVTSTIGSVA